MGFSVVVTVFISLVLIFVKLTRHFTSPQLLLVTSEWVDELSTDRYSPMVDLLTPQIATNRRTERCQPFQQYLHLMDSDFKRICEALKLIIVQSEQDRPDLASSLFRKEMTFTHRRIMVQAKLVRYRLGVDI